MNRNIALLRGSGSTRKYETYEFEINDNATLLDVLELLRTGKVPDLSYRHSCHHGSCGTCAVRVNGREVLACLTPVSSLYTEEGKIPKVDPLAVLQPLADLAVDPAILFSAQPEGSGTLRKSEWREGIQVKEAEDDAPVISGPKDAPDIANGPVRFEDCIECGSCVSACPVLRGGTGDNRGTADFMGPAALTAIHREYIKEPDKRETLLEQAGKPRGVAACKRYIECSRVCPRAVYPAKHIEMMRQELQKKLTRM